jgi:predicted enzyme related to lactoylglutathione lyase
VLNIDVSVESFGEVRFGVLDHEGGNGGCLVIRPDEVSDKGVLVYLNVNGRLRDAVAQVPLAGGIVLEEIHGLGPHGFRALVIDSEGNRIALHSNTDA